VRELAVFVRFQPLLFLFLGNFSHPFHVFFGLFRGMLRRRKRSIVGRFCASSSSSRVVGVVFRARDRRRSGGGVGRDDGRRGGGERRRRRLRFRLLRGWIVFRFPHLNQKVRNRVSDFMLQQHSNTLRAKTLKDSLSLCRASTRTNREHSLILSRTSAVSF